MKFFTDVMKNKPTYQGDQKNVDWVQLNFDDRKRGRLKVTTGTGNLAGIQIERGQILRDGTWLSNEDGHFLEVVASPEAVSTAFVKDSMLFAKACYHLGNRHVPLQICDGWLRYQEDYVLDQMLLGLGIKVRHEDAIFEPESGAYSTAKAGHDHGTANTNGHAHSH